MAEMSPAEFVQSLRYGRDGLGHDQYRRLVQDVVLAWHLGWNAETLRAYLTADQPLASAGQRGAGSLVAEYRRRLDPGVLPPPPRSDAVEPGRVQERCPAHPAIALPCGLCDEARGGRTGSGRIEGADAVRRALRLNAAAFRVRPRPQPGPVRKVPVERRPRRERRPSPSWREPTAEERAAEEWERRRALEALAAWHASGGPEEERRRRGGVAGERPGGPGGRSVARFPQDGAA